MDDSVIIVIPAKEHSRRLPNKNMLTIGGVFGGKPLFRIAIDRAVEANIGDVVVSTDSLYMVGYFKEVSFICDNFQYDIMRVKRPPELCSDNTRAWEVCLHAIAEVNSLIGKNYNTLIMTLPTSPFCTADDIRNAYKMFVDNDRKPVMSVTKVNFNPETLARMDDNNVLFPYVLDSWDQGISGDLKKVYLSNGAVFICDVDDLIKSKEQYFGNMLGYEMDEVSGLDVNTKLDLAVACCIANDKELLDKYERSS